MYVHNDCVICQEVRSNTGRTGEHPLFAHNQLKMCRPKFTPECIKIFSDCKLERVASLNWIPIQKPIQKLTGHQKRNCQRTLNLDSFGTNMMK